jgi:hypothetical protein
MPSLVLEVLERCELHGASRKVYVALAAYVESYDNGVFPSLITLAQSADISERHLQRCLKKLAKDGYLRIAQRKEPGKQVRNVYTLLFPWRLPAHKSTDNTAHKSTDIRCPSKDLKTQDNKERKRSGSGDMRVTSDTSRPLGRRLSRHHPESRVVRIATWHRVLRPVSERLAATRKPVGNG